MTDTQQEAITQSCTCKGMAEFYKCPFGCKQADSVQYCRKTTQGFVAGALANVVPVSTMDLA